VLVVGASATLVGVAGAQPRRELRVGAPGVPAALDPASALDGTVPLIARQVFDTLVAWREGTTDVEPALAARWSVSRDGLVWTFGLREGVRFHDGAPLTGGEVVGALERHLRGDPATPSAAWAALLRGVPGIVREVRAPDARHVQVVLVQPYAPLLSVLAHPGLGIARSVATLDGGARLVGTGPYRVVEGAAGRLALEAFAGHWAGPPRLDRIVFLEVATDEQAEAAFDAKALDVWFAPGPPRRTDWAVSTPGLRVGYLAFQTEKEPLSRRALRRAVAAALAPAAIAAALERTAVPLASFLPPAAWGRREGAAVIGAGREQARALLREGHWPAGFTPTLLAPLDRAALAEALQAMLGAADIPVLLRLEPGETARQALQAGEHDVALAEATVTGGDPHLFLFPLSTSEGAAKGPRARNFSFYRNPRLDDVLIRASQLAFRAERARLYERAQLLLADELPWVPLYVQLQWAVVRPEVRNLKMHPSGFHRLAAVGLDPGTQP
jgi:peptide/nickel transport system substrate-binding protein